MIERINIARSTNILVRACVRVCVLFFVIMPQGAHSRDFANEHAALFKYQRFLPKFL